ncbi:hypothetical protein [Yinghuangia soli]|uniref:Integral membrane protein n=1 Tax=Yinghuangia soli TaxID=2908204 RepID=A0AA41PV02_9ACTN|nr:hypothetical protein [Yinghuangia soli]MCF2526211.1 hypothetical protein [Yinghuangia soli]
MASTSGSAAAPTPPEPSSGDHPLDDGERAELARLRKRTSGRGKRRLRTVGAILAITLASILALVSVVAVWASDQIEDTDRYVATVAPLAEDPAVQNAVANRITNAITSRIDMDQVTDALADTLAENGLPANAADTLRRLSGPLESGVQSFVHTQAENVVQSDVFADLWTTVNRDAHAAVVKALTGQGDGALDVDGGTVTLQLGPIIAQVEQRLVDRGFSLAGSIPEVDRSIVLVQSDQLEKVRDGVELLHAVGWWLPIITLALAALGVWIAPNRRRGIMGFGIGLLVSMLVLGLALVIGRRIYLDKLPATVEKDAAAAIFDALVRFIRESARTLGLIGVLAALAAFLYGPAKLAVMARGGATKGLGFAGRAASDAGVRTGKAGAWIASHRAPLYAGVIGLGGLWLFLWNHPTPASVFLVAVLVLLVLALLETAAAAAEDHADRLAPAAAVPATPAAPAGQAPAAGRKTATWEADEPKSRAESGRPSDDRKSEE